MQRGKPEGERPTYWGLEQDCEEVTGREVVDDSFPVRGIRLRGRRNVQNSLFLPKETNPVRPIFAGLPDPVGCYPKRKPQTYLVSHVMTSRVTPDRAVSAGKEREEGSEDSLGTSQDL